ncbi:NAD(P)H-hydrate dehydratase [Flavobacteriaceae bacterium F89]|uniref:Bifunctional NAD(P)H-hydrate repair enzyme n=1 Tax=Cerina litoralis TaxID=2874477 RepID=A0AAE3ETW7_9FLAO|nr:NAD(P)H-hydrate dehydratase [Cerina litoralis]MCG2459532.1 NAD(P)H-hydrate dehydratase [Cerina litoralis]
MKIFSASQIYEADNSTIKNQGITSVELMERAANQVFNWMHLRLQDTTVKIHLFCGIGNNGGDGLAVARLLKQHGYNIGVYVVNYSDKRSQDFLINLDRLKDIKVWPDFISDASDLPRITPDDILVDAIFGIGLNRPPASWVVVLLQHMNRSRAFILAIDVPSGLFLDKVPKDGKGIVCANHTLTFQVPKLVFFLPQTGIYSNGWELLDIGLDQEYLSKTETDYELTGKNEVLQWYRPREKFSHKGTYGHALLVGGSFGKIGAVLLASRACLYSGSGLVTAYVPKCGYLPVQTGLPEAMVITDEGEEQIFHIFFDIDPSVIGIGVGMGTENGTVKAFGEFLKNNKRPLVIDADALNILSKNKGMLKDLPAKAVLTPHPKELERLIGIWKDDFDKLEKAKSFSKKFNCVLVIKGANTVVLYNDKGYVNTTGNPGMATGGSGDVLTGIITGLIAQGYDSLQAAIFGVYLHGRAGDIAVEKTGYQALTATGIIDSLGGAFLDLFQVAEGPQVQRSDNDS